MHVSCILINVISLPSSPKHRDGYQRNLVRGYTLKAVGHSLYVICLHKSGMWEAWTGSSWLRIGTGGGHL